MEKDKPHFVFEKVHFGVIFVIFSYMIVTVTCKPGFLLDRGRMGDLSFLP